MGRKTDFYSSTKIFSKKLALQELYFDTNFPNESLLRPQSKKYITTKNKQLDDIISTINKLTPTEKFTPDNLDEEERKALEEMKSLCESSVVLKKADKSNTLVLMDKVDYENTLVLKGHLLTSTYERAKDDANHKVYKELVNLCDKHQNCITANERKVILKDDWSESPFYVLPKIHKCRTILDQISSYNEEYVHIPFPNDLKGRPICGDVNSVTQGLSKLMDKILKPLVTHLRTFVKDEYHFLRKFPKTIPPNARVICCDVTSLYTSIPTDLGLRALDFWITKLASFVNTRFTKNFILESVNFILTNNFFQFNSTMWHQLCGTAMGKSFAPPYACLTMGYLEETVLFPDLIPRHFDPATSKLLIDFFMRYIDDDIMVLPESVSVEKFLMVINSMNPAIQHTVSTDSRYRMYEVSYRCTNFLSIKVLVDTNGNVKFDVYYKETNAHDYLSFDSHHPTHTKQNIPYVLAKRIVVISSEEEWVERNLRDLKRFLLDRKYPLDVIEKGFYNAQLQGPAPPPASTNVVPLISPYLGNFDSSNIVHTTKELIASSSNQRLRDAFKDTKIVQCYTQTPNLLQILSSSRFSSNSSMDKKENGVFKCKSSKCEICKFGYLQEGKSFIASNGQTWDVKCHITCQSLNVLYFLMCNFCLAETKLGKTDNLRSRTNNHRYGCREGKGSDIFDNHVYNCKGPSLQEPLFRMYVLMTCSSYDKLLNIERRLHLKGFDTTFKLV